jgi:hypothetical protein
MKRFSKFIPMAVVAIAMVGALSSFESKDSKETINIQGYTRVVPDGSVCNTSSMCSDDGLQLCTFGSTQVWGKDGAGKCVVELKRNHQ